jgi:2-dehydro-3-deoxyphosphooctonate aldolase (KDO 8-P synthase)
MDRIVQVGKIKFGAKLPFVLISGPCVIEDEDTVMQTAAAIKATTEDLNIPFIFKASYDKANRTSVKSFRGIGMDRGLAILKKVKQCLGIPVISDVHTVSEIAKAAKVLDVLQIPAFLCRQTDLLIAAGRSGKVVNIKKGQFLAPWDMDAAIKKVASQNNSKILLTERGTTFGYNNLVSDFRSLEIMSRLGYPVVFDASHSVQQPGGLGHATGGERAFIPLLARCGIAAGCAGIFMEVHPNPDKALSDGPNMLPLSQLENLLKDLVAIDKIVKKF